LHEDIYLWVNNTFCLHFISVFEIGMILILILKNLDILILVLMLKKMGEMLRDLSSVKEVSAAQTLSFLLDFFILSPLSFEIDS